MPVTDAPRHLAARYDVVVVGAGPAGMAAALGARERGAERVLLVDRYAEPGGILLQCIHAGFGLHEFREELTGPEYAQRFLERVLEQEVDVLSGAHVDDVTRELRVKLLSSAHGVATVDTSAVVLGLGARERTRAGMGRCQGGECTWPCMQLLASRRGLPVTAITKRGGGSWLVCDRDDAEHAPPSGG